MGAWLEWRGLIRTNEHETHRGFWCPACLTLHAMDERWQFDGDWDCPTFTPSFRTARGHYMPNIQLRPDGKWVRGEPTNCMCCHLNITKGQIIFHGDCTHAMAGRTVALTRKPEGVEDLDG